MRDGSNYSGQWLNGKIDGFGIAKYSNGQIYTGNFKNGKNHGKGKMILEMVIHMKAYGPMDYLTVKVLPNILMDQNIQAFSKWEKGMVLVK